MCMSADLSKGSAPEKLEPHMPIHFPCFVALPKVTFGCVFYIFLVQARLEDFYQAHVGALVRVPSVS